MALTSGTRLGPYDILSPIGKGGMGEVYKATDTRLDRTVAIKVLPEHLAESPERKARFQREAKAISQLNHPHICTLYDVGNQDGTDYLVMEYIEGETLAERLKQGALPLDKVLEYGIQIADGLDNAHRAGIVHRDLKPPNVMLTKSGVKLLDFGLARFVEGDVGPATSDAPTRQKDLTKEESLIGTLQYMAPEQLERKTADARTDIFAFGAVLYEMLTGKKAFEGTSQASLMTAIMSAEPRPVSELEPTSPPMLERTIRTCLEKDPDERWQSAGDLKRELAWVSEDEPVVSTSKRQSPRAFTWLVTTLGLIFAASTAWMWLERTPPSDAAIRRLQIRLPAEAGLRPFESIRGVYWSGGFALSPSGDQIVYVSELDGTSQLFARRLDELEPQPIPGTVGAATPFFSPDGQWIGYFDEIDGKLEKVSVRGGLPVVVCDVFAGRVTGASWGDDGTIVFATGGAMRRVAATGGVPELLALPDFERGQFAILFPQVLPGSRAVVFSSIDFDLGNEIQMIDLETRVVRTLVEDAFAPRYLPIGSLMYARRDDLVLAPFDLETLTLTGAAVSIREASMPSPWWHLPVHYAVSDMGMLVYAIIEGDDDLVPTKQIRLSWVSHDGDEQILNLAPGLFRIFDISPDGKQLAYSSASRRELLNNDVSILELDRLATTRLTFHAAADWGPLWTPDGRDVVFSSLRDGAPGIYIKSADGSGAVRKLSSSPHMQVAAAWGADRNELVTVRFHPETGMDLWVVSLDDHEPDRALLADSFDEGQPDISPDGEWLVYMSNEDGRSEIYVRPYPEVESGRWQVSTDGGREPVWSPSGRELYYKHPDGMAAVSVETTPTFQLGTERILFYEDFPKVLRRAPTGYDVAPDGRFLMARPIDELERVQPIMELVVIENWFDELERLAGGSH